MAECGRTSRLAHTLQEVLPNQLAGVPRQRRGGQPVLQLAKGPFRNTSFLVAVTLATITLAIHSSADLGFSQEPVVLVELDRQQVYEGESVRFRVLLNNFPQDAAPEFSETSSIKVRLVNQSYVNQVSSTNGRRIVRRGPLYEFELTPTATGNLALPVVKATLDGTTYDGQQLTLSVEPPSEQDLATIEISVEPKSVYPMQPFQVRVTMYVKPLPEPYSDRDPLEIRRTLPTLTIPWARDEESLPEGLIPSKSWDLWLGRMVDRESYGISVNDLQKRSGLVNDFFNQGFGGFGGPDPFDLFRGGRNRERRYAFRPTPTRQLREDGRGRMVEYWKYVFEREFIAERTADFEFGPSTLKGVFVSRVNTRGDVEGESIYAIANAINLSVKDPPEEGRPSSYTGAIGEFSCGAQLTPTTARVGDPLTLQLWLRGEGTLDRTLAPDLNQVPEIASQFKVYAATEDTQGSMRQFTYSLRPKQADIAEFPEVPISYFDVDREQYVTLRTDAIPLEISEADQLASDEIAMATPGTRRNSNIEMSGEGIFANVTNLSELRDETVRPDYWFGSLGGLAGLFFVLAVASKHAHRIQGDETKQRRRGATSRARQRLKTALADGGSSSRELADQIGASITSLVADAADVSADGMTSDEAARQLRQFGIDESLVSRMENVLAECDAARYGASSSSREGLGESATSLLDELIAALRRKKLLS